MQAYHFSLCFVYQKKFREKYNIYFSCSGSFTGEKCDVELCDDASYCKNGGTCTFNNNHTGNKACQCAPGYTGMSIQINFSNVHWSNPYSFFHAYSYRIMGKYKINVDDWLNGLSLENWKKILLLPTGEQCGVKMSSPCADHCKNKGKETQLYIYMNVFIVTTRVWRIKW